MMDDPVTVEQFCRRYVEPMGEESDHIHIVAITDALQVCSSHKFAHKQIIHEAFTQHSVFKMSIIMCRQLWLNCKGL